MKSQIKQTNIVTRFCPTARNGPLHVGNLVNAYTNLFYAKKHEGKFYIKNDAGHGFLYYHPVGREINTLHDNYPTILHHNYAILRWLFPYSFILSDINNIDLMCFLLLKEGHGDIIKQNIPDWRPTKDNLSLDMSRRLEPWAKKNKTNFTVLEMMMKNAEAPYYPIDQTLENAYTTETMMPLAFFDYLIGVTTIIRGQDWNIDLPGRDPNTIMAHKKHIECLKILKTGIQDIYYHFLLVDNNGEKISKSTKKEYKTSIKKTAFLSATKSQKNQFMRLSYLLYILYLFEEKDVSIDNVKNYYKNFEIKKLSDLERTFEPKKLLSIDKFVKKNLSTKEADNLYDQSIKI